MQLTRAADYAVRIMIHLASLPPGSRPNRGTLAEAVDIPEHFVGKVLQSLARARMIESHRGMNGGFALSMPPSRISLLDIMEAIEGPTQLNHCLAHQGGCPRKGTCPANRTWAQAQTAMTTVLRQSTIAALAAEGARSV